MVMVVAGGGMGVNATMLVVAVVCGGLQFQGHMGDALLQELVANKILDAMGISVCYDMDGGAMGMTVQTPNMEVVDIQNALYVRQVLSDSFRINVVGCFLQEEVYDFFQSPGGMEENEQGNTNGQNGINEDKICKLHDQGTYKNHDPAQYILQHMEVHRLLIQGMTATGEKGGTEVHSYADDGKEDHAVVADLRGIENTEDSIVHNHEGAGQEDQGCNGSSQSRVPSVAVGMGLVRGFLALPF